MKFTDLKLDQKVEKALLEQGYINPSEIQEKAIPYIIDKKDVFGQAETGSGKTCAFAAPIIHNFIQEENNRGIKCLILAPTRELAIQIHESVVAYKKYTKLYSTCIYGGVGEGNQKKELQKNVSILIATPGRLLDFINQGVVDLSNVSVLVLDEADRMLDMGFITDVEKIISFIKNDRQTLMFSATLPKEVKELASKILTNPIYINTKKSNLTVDTVEQYIYYVEKEYKLKLLIHLLKTTNIYSALVFCRTRSGVDRVSRNLSNEKIKTAAIHSDKSQLNRQLSLTRFKKGEVQVLVATDLVERGIDIEYLSHVINYDMPENTETYLHRIGRTARAGKKGCAITFCSIADMPMKKDIEKKLKIKLIEQRIDLTNLDNEIQTINPNLDLFKEVTSKEEIKQVKEVKKQKKK